MDFMEKITDLRGQKNQLLAKAQAFADEDNYDEVDKISAQMEGINNQIKSLEELAKQSRENAEPVYDGILHAHEKAPLERKSAEVKPFASLGEQLTAIYQFRKNHVEDKRLQQVNSAVLGTNEGVGSERGTDESPAQPAGPLYLFQCCKLHAMDQR